MAITSNGLASWVNNAEKNIQSSKGNVFRKGLANRASQKLINSHVKRTTQAIRSSPVAGKNVNNPNAPKPLPEATGDMAAPINPGTADIDNNVEAANNVGNTQQDVHTPEIQPLETQNPNEPNAIDEMGRSSTQLAEAAYKKRQAAAQAQQGSGGSYSEGSFDGSVIEGLDAEQSKYAQLIITNGRNRGMNDQDIQTALMTALAESGLRNLNYGDRDSVGLFQQRTSQGWGSIQQILDPNYSIGKFYDSLAGIGNRGGMSQWQAAQAVQRSAFADGSNYRAQYEKAMGIYKSYSTGAMTAPTMGANGSASWINSNNGRYHDYDGAYGAQCVDLYNFYVTGFVGGNPNQSRVVGAKDIWNNYDAGAMTRIAASQRPQQGDIVVWGSSWGGGYGHVGIVAGVNPDGTLKVLNANATSAGSRGNTVMSNYGMGGVLGFLRPNKLMGR